MRAAGAWTRPKATSSRCCPASWTRIGADGGGELAHGNDVIARAGDDVTLFGGAGADGALVVCAVEEQH